MAWHVHWLEDDNPLLQFQKALIQWLQACGFQIFNSERPFLPHVTICRKPFDEQKWERAFSALPLLTGDIHLYESVGNLKYEPIWTYHVKPPFEELEHTADLAFRVYGKDLIQLQLHAQVALAFKFPPIVSYFGVQTCQPANLDDIIIYLNKLVSLADRDVGITMKALSFHGEVIEEADGVLAIVRCGRADAML